MQFHSRLARASQSDSSLATYNYSRRKIEKRGLHVPRARDREFNLNAPHERAPSTRFFLRETVQSASELIRVSEIRARSLRTSLKNWRKRAMTDAWNWILLEMGGLRVAVILDKPFFFFSFFGRICALLRI